VFGLSQCFATKAKLNGSAKRPFVANYTQCNKILAAIRKSLGSRKVRSILKSKVRLLAIAVTGLLTAGCASNTANYAAQENSSINRSASALPADFSAILGQAVNGSSQFFANSPYGQQVTIQFEAPYFAASGATCRALVIEGQQSSTGLACTRNGQQWYAARPLTSGSVQ
jgi:hypothetical protein